MQWARVTWTGRDGLQHGGSVRLPKRWRMGATSPHHAIVCESLRRHPSRHRCCSQIDFRKRLRGHHHRRQNRSVRRAWSRQLRLRRWKRHLRPPVSPSIGRQRLTAQHPRKTLLPASVRPKRFHQPPVAPWCHRPEFGPEPDFEQSCNQRRSRKTQLVAKNDWKGTKESSSSEVSMCQNRFESENPVWQSIHCSLTL